MFAQVGRERRSNVALNQYHAEVLDEAASQLIAMKEALERLGSSETMTVPFMRSDTIEGEELLARIEYARKALLLTSEGTAP